jgi:uncharacterized protein
MSDSAMREPLTLDVLDEPLSVCRFAATAAVPGWVLEPGGFGNVTRTSDELSIVCATARVPSQPPGISAREDGWRALKVIGPFAFSEVGVLVQVAVPLAAAGISILAMATFETDYVLVQETRLADAVAELRRAGHLVHERETRG